MKFETHLAIMYICLIVFCTVFAYKINGSIESMEMQQKEFMTWLGREKLRDKDYIMQNRPVLGGAYHPDQDTYCVWVTNRTYSAQTDTERHEYLHYLIDEGECLSKNGTEISCYEHFCEGVW